MELMIGNTRHMGVEEPNICPHCHVTIDPSAKFFIASMDTDNKPCNISVWECSYSKCRRVFVVLYKAIGGVPKLDKFLNGYPKGPSWPKPILELHSGKTDGNGNLIQSRFILTYLQSLEAENLGLDELAGMGYRKAIEYLVKDWAIQNNPDKKEEIEKSWLAAVINTYYNGELKEILERASWLGNDQTHYNRLFEEFDIKVLKELIDLIMVELDRQYKKALYIGTIQKKK